jgi:large subunit ribosomal protein L22
VTWNIRVSPRKLNLMAGLIRGKRAQDAVAELTFNKRRIAVTVKKTLESAIANAENNHQPRRGPPGRVASRRWQVASVMKRLDARVRVAVRRHIEKWFSHLTIVVA